MKIIRTAVAVSLLALVGAVQAQAQRAPSGYFTDATRPDTLRILPPAPQPGDARDQADRAIFKATRALKDTPRWALAINDVDSAAIGRDMSCALGVELTPEAAPAVVRLIAKLAPDVSRATNGPKNYYGRKRPYLVDEGPICVEKTASLAASPDYPSGHSTWGWTVGLVLAELAPDRSTAILARARAFGESRLVCGVHNLSAVDAGRTNASAVVAALHGSEAFRADLEAARADLARARAAGPAPDAAACTAEAELVAQKLY